MIHRINIKALSINVCFQGRRFITPEYKKYKESLSWLLPKIVLPDAPYHLYIKFGFSNRGADLDNVVKAFVDSTQAKYNYNDKLIYKYTLEKDIVLKGQEYIEFIFLPYDRTETKAPR